MEHPFWGKVYVESREAENKFLVPGFTDAAEVSFSNWRVQEKPLTPAELDEHAEVFRSFIAAAPSLLPVIKEETFRYYQRVYADYFEDPEASGEPALGLTNADLHFAKLSELQTVTLLGNKCVALDFYYEVDTEHGLEIMFVDNRFYKVGGGSDVSPPKAFA